MSPARECLVHQPCGRCLLELCYGGAFTNQNSRNEREATDRASQMTGTGFYGCGDSIFESWRWSSTKSTRTQLWHAAFVMSPRCIALIAGCIAALLISAEATASTCNKCLSSAGQLGGFVAAAASDRGSLSLLQRQICSEDTAARQSCNQFVSVGFEGLASKLNSAPQVCADLGLCSANEALAALVATNGDANCPLCEYVVMLLKQRLEDRTEEADVVRAAEQACEDLPQEAQQACLEYVHKYSKDLFDWVHNAAPEEVCGLAGMCDQTARLTPLPQGLRHAITAVPAASNDDQCDTCQLVITEARSMLADPETQKEVLDYVKQSCDSFQSLKEQCEEYVDLYGPIVIVQAMQYLTPSLCSQLGFCTAGGMSLAA